MNTDLIDKVRQAGVIGAGGAGFPTYKKISGSYEIVIANGAECEPLLQCDQRLMENESSRIVRGLEWALKVTGAKRGIVALKKKHVHAIPAMQQAISNSQADISLSILGNYYPSGDEQVLVYEVLGRIVPEGGRPSDVGVLVQNVQTLAHVADAFSGRPVTARAVSIHGEVPHPKTIIAPIGARIRSLVDECGGPIVANPVIMTGGAMMGKIQQSMDIAIGKTTSGIYVLPADHPLIQMKSAPLENTLKQAKVACEQCSFCTMFCPRYLIGHSLYPHQIMQAVGWNSEVKPEIISGAYLCCECGICGVLYACPTGLSPDRYNGELKRKLAENKMPNPHSQKPMQVRLERESRRIPVETLTKRLGLTEYDKVSVWDPNPLEVNEISLSLTEHIGTPAVPNVQLGEKVTVGQLVAATPADQLGTCVHSSIDGKVVAIDNSFITIKQS